MGKDAEGGKQAVVVSVEPAMFPESDVLAWVIA